MSWVTSNLLEEKNTAGKVHKRQTGAAPLILIDLFTLDVHLGQC